MGSRTKLFRRNDFDLVYNNFFKSIWESGEVYADPSGWRDTEAQAAGLLPAIQVNEKAFGRYYLDEGDTLGHLKDHIIQLVGAWENRFLGSAEVTLYNSVSTATAAVLITLKRLGVRTIMFETPAYGVTVNQAKYTGFKVGLLPSYYDNNFTIKIEPNLFKRSHPVAVWLTQPRMSLGFDQEEEFIGRLLDTLSPSDFLVIDEATEQRYPSVLSYIFQRENTRKVIRIRGLLKPLGLNGFRLACVLHPSGLRESLESAQEVLGASLDLYSLQMASELSLKKDIFFTMLSVANSQVTTLRKKAEMLASGSGIRLSPLVNGYMGCAFVPFEGGKPKYNENRNRLLSHCRTHRMPVILGSSMFFGFDPKWEQIRINYFSREHHVIRAIDILRAFTLGIGQ